MKIKFLYIENGKITLTRQELEQLLEESYQDGVAEGRKSNNSGGDSITCPPSGVHTPDYYTSPYWGIDRSIPVTCNDSNVVTISSTGGSLKWTEAGTITIADNCAEYDSVYSTCATSIDGCVSGKTCTDAVSITALSTSLKEE